MSTLEKAVATYGKDMQLTVAVEELSELIKGAIPVAARDGGHPAKRSFQAIRIEVNSEFSIIEPK